VENIGQRIRQLRESRGMTQSQLQSKSGLAFLSVAHESGQMTPSLGTLEKSPKRSTFGLNRFFIPESDGEALLEDPFIQDCVRSCSTGLGNNAVDPEERLQAISDHVNVTPANLRPIGNPSRLPQPATANGGAIGHAPSISNGHALNHTPRAWSSAGLPAAAAECSGVQASAGR